MNLAPHFVLAITTFAEEADVSTLEEWTRLLLSYADVDLTDDQIRLALFKIADRFTLRGAEWLAKPNRYSERRERFIQELNTYAEEGKLQVYIDKDVEVVWDFA